MSSGASDPWYWVGLVVLTAVAAVVIKVRDRRDPGWHERESRKAARKSPWPQLLVSMAIAAPTLSAVMLWSFPHWPWWLAVLAGVAAAVLAGAVTLLRWSVWASQWRR